MKQVIIIQDSLKLYFDFDFLRKVQSLILFVSKGTAARWLRYPQVNTQVWLLVNTSFQLLNYIHLLFSCLFSLSLCCFLSALIWLAVQLNYFPLCQECFLSSTFQKALCLAQPCELETTNIKSDCFPFNYSFSFYLYYIKQFPNIKYNLTFVSATQYRSILKSSSS